MNRKVDRAHNMVISIPWVGRVGEGFPFTWWGTPVLHALVLDKVIFIRVQFQ